MTINQAMPEDLEAIGRLLRLVRLPTDNIDDHLANFLVARDHEKIIGCAGMEVYGETCLMRSLAVHPEYQRSGLGRRLLQTLIDRARARGLKEAVALTNTATRLASQFGFEPIPREAVDPHLATSWEFQANACQTATCLKLRL